MNSNTLNIGGQSSDPFYRYKMPAISILYQRKAGGTTVVANTVQICKSLNRDSGAIAKWLSKQLSQPVQVVKGCWQLRGTHTVAELQAKIGEYIKQYVLCRVCGNPETKPVNAAKLECVSCGYTF